MTQAELINKTAREVVKYQDSHYQTSMSWEKAIAAANDWYNHTDITSPYLLSACILAFGETYTPVTHKQIIDAARSFEN